MPPQDLPASDYQPSESNPEDSTYQIMDNDSEEEKYGGGSHGGTGGGDGALESSQ